MGEQYYHYIIQGKVQGVGYRKFTFDKAKQLKVRGWVKNLPTGEVECLAIGEVSTLSVFEKYLRKGSPLSRISNIRVKAITENFIEVEQPTFTSIFEIRY